jgi:SnoaL-like domain
MEHSPISPAEAADRLAIRELIDAYAHCADRRDADGQRGLFTDDTHFVVYMNGMGTEATEDLHGSEQLIPVFAALKQYEVTMHFNGQSTVTLDGERASGETYCIAHHVFSADGERKIMLAYLRYLDSFAKQGATWLFAERNLYLEFSDTRALGG